MVWLSKDPKGVNIFSSTQHARQQPSTVLAHFSSNTVDSILSDKTITDNKKIELLATRVRELEANVGLIIIIIGSAFHLSHLIFCQEKILKSLDTVTGRASVSSTLNDM